tara:strand:+ start:299 stop:475 length:177 start_codon:yes stop_codon:yes gene_type:complete
LTKSKRKALHPFETQLRRAPLHNRRHVLLLCADQKLCHLKAVAADGKLLTQDAHKTEA